MILQSSVLKHVFEVIFAWFRNVEVERACYYFCGLEEVE